MEGGWRGEGGEGGGTEDKKTSSKPWCLIINQSFINFLCVML